jgi:hypothetical protein
MSDVKDLWNWTNYRATVQAAQVDSVLGISVEGRAHADNSLDNIGAEDGHPGRFTEELRVTV